MWFIEAGVTLPARRTSRWSPTYDPERFHHGVAGARTLAVGAQVEQDLVISRARVEIFRVQELASSLLFRGGTALYKLYFTPAARYSEDIDFVQAGRARW